MTNVLLPAIWLIVLIVGLPQLSETVYTPALPDIALFLHTSASAVEHTLSIYLFSFAIGTMFWGVASDYLGRKPCIIAGLVIFVFGTFGCYSSTSIEMLMFSRSVQAFGGSIGSVLGQAICRDAFHGPKLGEVYSIAGSALALFPALGPVIGGFFSQYFGWHSIFLFLIGFAFILLWSVIVKLPETHNKNTKSTVAVVSVASKLIKDKKVIGLGVIVAACNGISFSYFAEGSFYLINILGLSASEYGISFVAIAFATMLGGVLSKRLQSYQSSLTIMTCGLYIIFVATALFSGLSLLYNSFVMSRNVMIAVTILSQMCIMFGVCMATSNALALSLIDYKWCIGTASSLFGCFYYWLIALFTFGMGVLHNGTLLAMPFYFFGISIIMCATKKKMVRLQ